MNKAETYNSMSAPMKALIQRCVENACDFVNDMMAEADYKEQLATPLNAIYDQAMDFMCNELDPERDSAFELPTATRVAIREFIIATVGFQINSIWVNRLNNQ